MSLLLPLIVKKCVFLQGLWQYLWFWPLFAVSNKTHNAFTPALPWQMRQLIRDWQKSSKQMQVLLSVSVCAWCIYVWKYYTNPLYFTFCCVYCTMICVIIPYYTMMCASNMCFLCVLCVYCSLSLSVCVCVCVHGVLGMDAKVCSWREILRHKASGICTFWGVVLVSVMRRSCMLYMIIWVLL